jgi:hypothetical protein
MNVMRKTVGKMNQEMRLRDISDKSLIDLQEELYWVIFRARENAKNICEQAGFTPEEAGLQFLHPTIGPRKNYTMICLRVE